MEEILFAEETAKKIAQEWIEKRVPVPENQWRRYQKRWLMNQLAPLCIAETIRNKGGEPELEQYLYETLELLDNIWYETAPAYAQDYRRKIGNTETEPDEKEKEKIELARLVIWQRRDPKISFQEGLDSEHHFEPNRDSVHSDVVIYLRRPWLRHPVLDWIFMDIMTTGEICAYGEAIKQKLLPGKKDWLGMHPRYLKARGNIEKMGEINWEEVLQSLGLKFFWAVAFPIAAIWAAFHYQWETTGMIILSLYALIVILFFSVKIVRLIKRTINALCGKPDPRTMPFQLWGIMYEVWQALAGPIINPTMLKEKMQKAAEKGAVWDAPSLALIDKVILHDPAVWIVEQSTT